MTQLADGFIAFDVAVKTPGAPWTIGRRVAASALRLARANGPRSDAERAIAIECADWVPACPPGCEEGNCAPPAQPARPAARAATSSVDFEVDMNAFRQVI